MSDPRTKDADLAAIKARYEFNYALVASNPKIADNPLVIAAVTNSKASYAAFLAALAEVEAERSLFRMWRTHRHFRQACAAADSAHAALRFAIESAEDEHNQTQASQDAAPQEPSDSEPTAQGAWDYFRGKPNTKAVLEEKANVLVRLIVDNCDTGLLFAAKFKDKNSDIRLGDDEARQSMTETAAFLLILVDIFSFKLLGSENSEVFMRALVIGVARALQDKGVAIEAFQGLLLKRFEEFRREDIEVTLRAFGKKIAVIFGIGPNIAFDLFLENALLSASARWKLNELLHV